MRKCTSADRNDDFNRIQLPVIIRVCINIQQQKDQTFRKLGKNKNYFGNLTYDED